MPSGYISSHPLKELLASISWFPPSQDTIPRLMTDELAEQWAMHLITLFPKLAAGRKSRLTIVKDWKKVCEAMQRLRESGCGA